MKSFLFALILLSSVALQAQEKYSIAALQRKSNLKVTLIKGGESYFQSPFYLNNHRYLGLEYERHLKGKHTLTAGGSFYKVNNLYGVNNFKWYSAGLELGYRYYLLPFKGKQPFNGFYTGVGSASYYNYGKQVVDGRVNNIYKHFSTIGNIKLGVQTTFLRRFSFDVEANYTVDRFFLRRIETNTTLQQINTTVRIGYTF